MSERMIVNRVKKLKALEAQQKEIEAQIEALRDEIKADMQKRGVEQQAAGDFLIRWTTIVSSRFDGKTFQKEHAAMYSRYLKQTESRRFSIV